MIVPALFALLARSDLSSLVPHGVEALGYLVPLVYAFEYYISELAILFYCPYSGLECAVSKDLPHFGVALGRGLRQAFSDDLEVDDVKRLLGSLFGENIKFSSFNELGHLVSCPCAFVLLFQMFLWGFK